MYPQQLDTKPVLDFQKLFRILSHLLDTNHIHSWNGYEHFSKVLKEGFKLMLRWKKSKFQNASTLQRFHQVTPSPSANLVTCMLFPYVLQHMQDSYNDFFASKNGKSFAGRSCFKKSGQIGMVLWATLPLIYCSRVNHQKIWRHSRSEVICCVEN